MRQRDKLTLRSMLAWFWLMRIGLINSDFTGASFIKADLTGAHLAGANFTRALLDGALLRDAAYDDTTQWPDDFDPVAAGALRDST